MEDGDGNDRLAQRHDVLLHARCRQSPWHVFDVELGNISAGGCAIIGSGEHFRIGQILTLRIAKLKPLPCSVIWIEQGAVGVEFKTALSERIIAFLDASYGLAVARGGAPAVGS